MFIQKSDIQLLKHYLPLKPEQFIVNIDNKWTNYAI